MRAHPFLFASAAVVWVSGLRIGWLMPAENEGIHTLFVAVALKNEAGGESQDWADGENNIQTLAIEPRAPQSLFYADTCCRSFRSTNGGKSWSTRNKSGAKGAVNL